MNMFNSKIRNVHFLEFVRGSGDRKESVEEVVDGGGDAEAGEEGHLVDTGCGQRDGSASGSSESDDVNEDTEDVGSVRAEVDTPGIVVPAIFSGIVKIFHIIVTTTDNVVFSDHNASNRAEEDRVRGEVGSEVVTTFKEIPWKHAEPNNGGDVTSTTDVDKAGEEGSKIASRTNRVG